MGLVKSNTPMMQQFNAIKRDHLDCILFFRAGDFYEMFGEDAIRASGILNITLTTRNKSSENAVPMAGIPYHAYEQYLNKLTAAGVKVAICEQMEDPSEAKGVVRREVVRVVTPGTTLSSNLIDDDRNNFILALEPRLTGKPFGLSLVDLSTGQFEVMEIEREPVGRMWSFLLREAPSEILMPEARNEEEAAILGKFEKELKERIGAVREGGFALESAPSIWFDPKRSRKRLNDHFKTTNLGGFGVDHMDTGLRAAGALLAYLDQTQKCELIHLSRIGPRQVDQGMWLDPDTVHHLELFENHAPGGRNHTLFAVLNKTNTPMGARLLRRWMGHPLLDYQTIEARLEAVGELKDKPRESGKLREALGAVGDLERIVARINLPVVGVADVVALRESMDALQELPEALEPWKTDALREITLNFDPMTEVRDYLRMMLLAEPSLKITEGGYINCGVNAELDQLRELSSNSKGVISALEARERQATGIGSLKVKFNKVFGYYLEVSKLHHEKVPATYIRKQTLVNAERYTTLELEEIEEKILGAEERIGKLEYELFQELRTILGGYARRLQVTAAHVAGVDALSGLAQAAREYGYCRPSLISIDEPRRISIRSGRHPVLERIEFDEPFIPNDLSLEADIEQVLLITGPNMAGKSTVMRQTALIQLMAQMGSFIPAESAELSLVDKIFTRVGASDNLSRGQSTFMMEMNEAANILNNATENSLLILDEIGRGTSTYDGISIAWAMVEYIHRLGALTLFATHYHELTQLARELPRMKNYNITIAEEGDHLVFPRKLKPGEADKSYGIQVARMAGLPGDVIKRAHEVMDDLTAASDGSAVVEQAEAKPGTKASPAEAARSRQQLSFLSEIHPLVESIRTLPLDEMTPREALDALYRMRESLEKGKDF